ncbi:MAG: hypothetical protein KC492_23760, partial [Myxococcales bacterium]|nr:hypothetical protein [Myxococcales bacterium]
MSDSAIQDCGWPSLAISVLMVLGMVCGGYAMVWAVKGRAGRRRLVAVALGVACLPIVAGFIIWALKHSTGASPGSPLELQGRACAEVGFAGTFFNGWLAAGALILA